MSSRDLVVAAAGASAPSDPNFKNVSLLLSGDGTNGAQNNTFLDSSTNNFTITRNGNTTQGTFSPYGNLWSNYFDGSGDYLTAPSNAAFAVGTGDFTIEFWGYWNSVSSAIPGNVCHCVNNGTLGIYIINNSMSIARYNTGGDLTANTTQTTRQWDHYAFTRQSGTGRIFKNGVQVASGSVTTNYGQNGFQIGTGVSSAVDGYISNLRFVNGTALYTSNFTPSTTPLTAVSGTSLLTCQSNRFIDNSSNNFAITVNGNTSVQRFSPFNPTAPYSAATIGGSGYFDGSGDSLSSTTVFESATNTSTFTIEGFVFPTTFATLINIIGGMVVTSGEQKSIAAEVNTSGQVALYWFDGSIKRCTGNSVMQLNAWNYFAIVVNNNSISIYVNKTTADTLTGTTTLTNRTQSVTLGVGAYYNNGSAQYFNGYLSNLRYSTVARTISSIPTTLLSSDSNTRWLLNFTNAGIPDAAMMNDLETVGNAQVSTSVKKYGTGSLYFDGSGDYLVAPSSSNFEFGGGDFTIEAWVKLTSAANYGGVITKGGQGTLDASIWSLEFNNTSNALSFYIYGAGYIVTSTTNVRTSNTWTHVAVTRSGNNTKIFINGTQEGSTYTSGYTIGVGNPVYIGSGFYAPSTNTITGYIDDLRITKGVARYTANFTPPAQALPTN